MLKSVADDHRAGTIIKANALYAQLRDSSPAGFNLVNIEDTVHISRQDHESVLALYPVYYGLNQFSPDHPNRADVDMEMERAVYVRLLCCIVSGLNDAFQASAWIVLGTVTVLDAQASIKPAPVKLPDRCAEKVMEYMAENKEFDARIS
jgi:hypothetical protein